MDLHLTNERATKEESAAVDSVLGAPDSSWQGGVRQLEDTRTASNQQTAGQRHRLLPVLHAVQNHIGWISLCILRWAAFTSSSEIWFLARKTLVEIHHFQRERRLELFVRVRSSQTSEYGSITSLLESCWKDW